MAKIICLVLHRLNCGFLSKVFMINWKKMVLQNN